MVNKISTKELIEKIDVLVDWFNILPQAYDEGLSGNIDKTMGTIFEKSEELKSLIQQLKEELKKYELKPKFRKYFDVEEFYKD